LPQEKEYIFTEARRVFRENKAVTSEKEVAQLVRACMQVCPFSVAVSGRQLRAVCFGR